MQDKHENLISVKDKYKNLIQVAGCEGKYQNIMYFIMIFVSYISGFACILTPLHKILPDYICISIKDFQNYNLKNYNVYKNDPNRFKIFKESQCESSYCTENDFLIVDYFSNSNFITHLDLFCKNEFFIYYTQSLFAGRIIGMLIFSYVADKKGRLLCFYIILYSILFSLIGILLFKNHLLIILFSGICNSGLYLWNHSVVMSSETMSEKLYTSVGVFTTFAFSISGIINIILMYYFKSWLIILYYYLIITIIVLYFSHLYLTETPLFLLENNRFEELKTVLTKIINLNFPNNHERIKAFRNELNNLQEELNYEAIKIDFDRTDNGKRKEHFLVIFTNLAKNIFQPYLNLLNTKHKLFNVSCLSLLFIAPLYVYYGQLLYIETLPGNILTNLSIIYITELVVDLFAYYIVKRYDRRHIMKICNLISSVICVLIVIFKEFQWFLILNVFCLTSANSILIVALNIYMSETIDINIKSITVTTCLISSNGMFLILPYLILIFGNPYVTYGIFSLICYFILI